TYYSHILRPSSLTLLPYTTLFRSRHIHHEVGAGKGEDDRHFGLVGDQGVDTDALVVTVHQRQDKRPFLSLAEDAPHQIGALVARSEEHTSELQSRENLVCRLLLEK